MNGNTPRPHIVFLVTEDWYFVSHRLSIAKAALAAGYRVTVVTRVDRCEQAIRAAGIDVVHLPAQRGGLNPVQQLAYCLKVYRLYRRLRPDIVHHVAMKPVIYGSIAARLAGVHHVVNALGGLGFVFTSDAPKARVLRPLVNRLLHVAMGGARTLLILQNRDDRRMIVEGGVIDDTQVRMIRGVGVNVESYPQPEARAGECLVILPARLLRDKGVVEFAEAARRLKAEGVAARFALVGEPDEENPASLSPQEISGWVEEGFIEAWGWRDDMPRVVAQADLVCLPSYREGLPKALLEACAAGKAIVTTDTPGCREVVEDGYNGLLVPVRNVDALVDALRTLIGDSALRHRYGLNGRRLAQTQFSEQAAIAASLAVYRELVPAR
ncbi:glycosyltransferase family 4 protein [Trinickia sp. NRRL B-1857]|uniref:glycosyltransferase family 4 protein n=1 Tax=Trinickia sp. NRRL B-1857 TaxID=3162879 RepID=UPI003D2BA8AB